MKSDGTILNALLTAFTLLTAAPLAAQTVTLSVPYLSAGTNVRTTTISVRQGEVFEAISWLHSQGSGQAVLKRDGMTVVGGWLNGGSNGTLPKTVIAGPANLVFEVPENAGIHFTYRLSPETVTASQNVSSQVVVIPENSGGNVDVILESSVDLVNWSAALPGSYTPSTARRFFRVRLLNN